MNDKLFKLIILLISYIFTTAILHLSLIGTTYFLEFTILLSSLILLVLIIHYTNDKKLKIFKINGVGYYTCPKLIDAESLVESVIKMSQNESYKDELRTIFMIEEVGISESKSIKVLSDSDITLYDLYKDNSKSITRKSTLLLTFKTEPFIIRNFND